MSDNESVNNQAQPAPEGVVTLTDLQNVLVVIDLASNRGAFRGPELAPVGALYDKINRFLQSVMPQAAPNGTEESGTESSTTVTDGSEVSTDGGAA